MKLHSFSALLASLVLTASAQDGNFQTPALLVENDGARLQVWLVAATKSAIRYRETEIAVDTKDAKIRNFTTIFILEPKELSEAMDLFEGRKYEDAKAKFIDLKERFKSIQPLANSPSALGAFYEMECLRKLGDLEGLAKALQSFDKEPITRETQLRQLELYVMWDAVRSKSWDRLEILAKERAATRLPGDQRAQVAYCHGLALEGLERPDEALLAYETAMTADSGTSEEVTRQATLRVLAIHGANAGVKDAIKQWGTPGENKNSKGYSDLVEAAAVAELFEMSLGAGTPLPPEYKEFLKYKPQAGPKTEAPKAEDSPKVEEKPKKKGK